MKVVLADGTEVDYPVSNCTGYRAKSISLEAKDLRHLASMPPAVLYACVSQLAWRVREDPPNDPPSSSVVVPKDLLKIVLDEAAGNNAGCEGEFSCSDADRAGYEAERDRIDELRRIAGIE